MAGACLLLATARPSCRRRLPLRLCTSWSAPLDQRASARQRRRARRDSRWESTSAVLWRGPSKNASTCPGVRAHGLMLTAGCVWQAKKREARRESGEVCEHGVWKCR